MPYDYLNPDKSLIFRIEHVDNLPWDLEKEALYCRNSGQVNPNYVNIGNPDLISKRSHQKVPIAPGGTLSDYVPFYFTPFSVMMFNILTGYGGVRKREKEEIIIYVSSIRRLQELGIEFVFTDQHASAVGTRFHSDVERLDAIHWEILQNRDFKTDDAYPGKQVRYQAEALVHLRVPMEAIKGICCVNEETKRKIETMSTQANFEIAVHSVPGMYF